MSGVGLSLRGLTKSYGALRVLRGIDLDVNAGEFVAVVGRSGCGKSTLLRVIGGLETGDGGDICFADDAAQKPRLMFQEPRLLPWASVLANVEVGLGAARGTHEGRERALAALRAVGLGERADAWPSVLSGGQKQRVALARALVSRPEILALDEPLGALDALTRIEMQRLIEDLWRETGFTAVLVTHDVAEALTLADRVILIENGAIALDLKIDLPRPRRRDMGDFAKLEETILARVLGRENAA